MTSKSQVRQTNAGVLFPWLTIEIVLWGLLFILALGLRLIKLDLALLNSTEARDALAAWHFAQGKGAPSTTGYSPVLFTGQWFTFLIFGANDFTARLLPAAAGTALVLTPALLRQQLGRNGALATGALLALSPTAVYLSRIASGDIFAVLGALLCASGLWRYLDSIHQSSPPAARGLTRAIVLSALGAALMLASSPLGFSAAIAMLAALVFLVLVDKESRVWFENGWAILRATPNLASYALGAFLGGFVLLSTAFAWHFGGLASAADLLPQWFSGFVRWPDSLGPSYPGLVMVFYEPLILLTGAAGVMLAATRGTPVQRFLTLWSIGALLLSLIRPGRGPGDVLLIIVPLACLGGLALATLAENLRQRGRWLNEGLLLAVSLPLWVYLLLNLATYSSRPGEYSHIHLLFINISVPTFLSLGIATVFLLLIMAAGLGLMQGAGTALRGLALSVITALLVYTIATTVGLNQNRPDDPRELLVREPTVTEARLLRQSLLQRSNERQGDAHAIDVTVLTDDPAVSWLLRNFDQARVAEPTGDPILTSAVVAPQTLGTPSLGGSYVGQDFPLRRRWEPNGLGCQWNLVQLGFDQVPQLDCNALVQWILFRRSPMQPSEEQIVLWMRQDLLGW